MSNLYRVTFIDQSAGERLVWYVLAKNTTQVDEEFADIIKIEYLPYEDLTNPSDSLSRIETQ